MEKNNKTTNQDNKKRIILMIIALIIIILALLTSCSCASKFFGKIGSLFVNEGNFLYKEKEGNFCEGGLYCETIINRNLTFDQDVIKITLTDDSTKLTYSYYGIDPKKFTCTTSDASIATCYVNSNGYVVINPKREGTVIITLQTEENDIIYEATSTVNIGASSNGIFMQYNKGTIDLYYTNKKAVAYSLLNINGKVIVTSSDPSIATAIIENGLLKITAHKTGKVTFTLSVEYGGKTYEAKYNLTVIKSSGGNIGPENPTDKNNDATLSGLTTNLGPVIPTFNPDIKDYIINIGENDNSITVTATPNSASSTVIYSYKGSSNSTGTFDDLEPGKNIITVTITAEDGTVNIYTITVNKPDSSGGGGDTPAPIEKSKLTTLTTKSGPLNPLFNPNKYEGYEITIGNRSIDIDATTSGPSTITYSFGSITNTTGIFSNLRPGKNTIIVTVKEDGKTEQKYVITVITPSEYDISFNKKSYDCYYETKTCKIDYIVKKDGTTLPIFDLKDVSIELIGSFNGEGPTLGTSVDNELGYVFLTPDTSKIQDPVELKITYIKDGKTYTDQTTVNFKTKSYYATPGSKEYDMNIDEKRSISIMTNFFSNDSDAGKKQILNDMIVYPTNKGFKLVSVHDSNLWLEINTDSPIIDSLELDKTAGLSSMILKAKANATGDATIKITGSAYGVAINEEIKIHVYKSYTVIVSAGDGKFNETSKEYKFTISDRPEENTIDLSKYDKPYLVIPGDECNTYKFLGFVDQDDITDPNDIEDLKTKIKYNVTGDNHIIEAKDIIKDTTTFVAVYDPVNKEPKPPMTDYIWLVDVPLFFNKEYHDKYNEDKVIYPGAHGSYTMHLGNATSGEIKVVEMTLEEETICVDINKDGVNDGCLNMGYIIKTGNRIEETYVGDYLYGNYIHPNYKYQVLHNHAGVTKQTDENKDKDRRFIHTDVFDVSDKNSLVVPANTKEEDGLAITIHWQWIDYDDYEKGGINDKIDTAIGNYAYEQGKNDSKTINDLYTLKVGLKLEIEDKIVCPKD